MKKDRLDIVLVSRGLISSRAISQRIIMAGQVRVDGEVVFKPSTRVNLNCQVEIKQLPRFVSRGGEKLEAALHSFDVNVDGAVCADVGASTGGFTDCLLQHGAAKVYAIDVGHGILHWKIRRDNRVIVMEKTNARYLDQLLEPVNLITIDAAFISLKVLLPVVRKWLPKNGGNLIILIKPQFEAGRRDAARGKGVIRDEKIHRQILLDILSFAVEEKYKVLGLIRSPLLGPKGNIEFLGWLQYPSNGETDWQTFVDGLIPNLESQ
ncbi:MAG TPA: TlyA family RNA methyltransferase [Anaerolineae bacterium]|nr:TlyA family RNA methyltransferase [Anaerolineae bacterium]